MPQFLKQTQKQTMHIIYDNGTQQHCYDFPKTLYTGGIRTRAFCSRGGCNVHCATPPRQGKRRQALPVPSEASAQVVVRC
jgi:hypothetical protein